MTTARTTIETQMSANRPRLRGRGICAGCRAVFADYDAFTLHATGKLNPASTDRRRCRSPAEMRALGMRVTPNTSVWHAANNGRARPRKSASE